MNYKRVIFIAAALSKKETSARALSNSHARSL